MAITVDAEASCDAYFTNAEEFDIGSIGKKVYRIMGLDLGQYHASS